MGSLLITYYLLISKKIDWILSSNSIDTTRMSIPSFPPPSYDDVIEMDTMKRCNEIWSKFDGVMEKYEVKSKKNFFSLPSHIREMIWKIKNRELDEKFENLKKENDYNKKLFIFEYIFWINLSPSFREFLRISTTCPSKIIPIFF